MLKKILWVNFGSLLLESSKKVIFIVFPLDDIEKKFFMFIVSFFLLYLCAIENIVLTHWNKAIVNWFSVFEINCILK